VETNLGKYLVKWKKNRKSRFKGKGYGRKREKGFFRKKKKDKLKTIEKKKGT